MGAILMNTIPENIGQFYLGMEVYPGNQPVLYDAVDLTTHAVIIGMTGSGKTGLGISLLEEAALDHIPIIAIDPKGDIGNLMLNFPQTRAEDFMPYADATVLAQENKTPEQWAEHIAQTWRNGINNSHQSAERMQMLKDSNPVHLYTPGSTTGIPLALFSDFPPPEESIRKDSEAYSEYLDATAGALLSLLKKDHDSLSPQHIFLTHILKHHWDNGAVLTLADLIANISNPPFSKIGILPVNQVFPNKSRNALALSLNSLIASASFANWRKGQPLECEMLFYDQQKNPQTSVLNIAHLNDEERMYFVTLLLSNLINWMRRQQGTSTLRAILYMDEIAGYLPPNANPTSKALFLTLLKQARAFGLGLVLSTQNPIDLDYKALSNAGTWLIGRLQTAQDRERISQGLLSAGANGIDSKEELNDWLNRLEKRTFLLKNVHEEEPCIFHTRWAMSYLAGPLSKAQIETLTANSQSAESITPNETSANNHAAILPAGIKTYYFPTAVNEKTHYFPTLLGAATVFYQDKRAGIQSDSQVLLNTAFDEKIDWKHAETVALNLEQLQSNPQQPAVYHDTPVQIEDSEFWKQAEKSFKTVLRQHSSIEIFYCPDLKIYGEVGENEESFRNRLTSIAHEKRDEAISKLRGKYAKKQRTLIRRKVSAQHAIERETKQASGSLMDAGMAIGGALLGAFMGRKMLSQTNIRRATSAMRRTGKIGKERQDIIAAEEKMALVDAEIEALEEQLSTDLATLQAQYNPQTILLERKTINAKSSDIQIDFIALAYRALG